MLFLVLVYKGVPMKYNKVSKGSIASNTSSHLIVSLHLTHRVHIRDSFFGIDPGRKFSAKGFKGSKFS